MLALERVFRMDPWLLRKYLIEERAHIDYVNNMKDAREEGIAEGREEWRKEGRKKGIREAAYTSARKLRSQGILSDEQTADALDIPVEVVKTL